MDYIRKICKFEDYHSVSKELAKILEEGKFDEVFSNFRAIYEFIIQMHKLYGVKLNSNTDDVQDALLLELMHNTFRKFT
jgi:flagellin-specific chaperone FliS